MRGGEMDENENRKNRLGNGIVKSPGNVVTL